MHSTLKTLAVALVAARSPSAPSPERRAEEGAAGKIVVNGVTIRSRAST
jgi:hypothetical protein